MLPLQVGRDYRALLADADVCFITQQVGAGNSFFPSKLLGLLAQSKPVITVAAPQCELAMSLGEGKFGVNVAPGQARELAELLDALANDPGRLAQFGEAGRRYVEQFEKSRVFENFVRELAGVL
jgi:colanic acid biosynthesis glycosyl transferase WcaI